LEISSQTASRQELYVREDSLQLLHGRLTVLIKGLAAQPFGLLSGSHYNPLGDRILCRHGEVKLVLGGRGYNRGRGEGLLGRARKAS